ncbi:MAG: OAM dimerization domain-containing protein [Candidatus Cloacimonetes bacterium]|nr:OAM dimerization domain-containing protein [Candidatus Cloacimonadota bacterium]
MQNKIDQSYIRPYGDTNNDGRIQISFSMPVKADETGKEAARILLRQMGLEEIEICYIGDQSEGFSHIVAYGNTKAYVDLTKIKIKTVDTEVMTMDETDEFVDKNIGRKITIIGACIESDAHTVGIDAIINMKGYNHRFGLERYRSFNALNMGAQVLSEDLLSKAREMNADVVLVSQIVTQKNIHIQNLTKLIEMAEAEGLRDKMLFICGGPRITHELAIELGYDAGFGAGSYSTDVASYIVQEMTKRKEL